MLTNLMYLYSRGYFDNMTDSSNNLDVEESDESLFLKLSIPGYKKEEITISVDNNRLYISGKKTEDTKKTIYWIKTHPNEYSKTINIPDKYDLNTISAKLENGILLIEINKLKERKKRTIEIS